MTIHHLTPTARRDEQELDLSPTALLYLARAASTRRRGARAQVARLGKST